MKHEINGIKSLLSDEWRVMQAATHGPDPVYIVQMSIELDGRDVATGDLHHLLSKKTVETIENTHIFKRSKDTYESYIKLLEKQVKDLEKYKIHFDLEKGQL